MVLLIKIGFWNGIDVIVGNNLALDIVDIINKKTTCKIEIEENCAKAVALGDSHVGDKWVTELSTCFHTYSGVVNKNRRKV